MAEKFWTHLKLKNGDTVKFVPPAPNGEQLGGITQREREEIGELKDDKVEYFEAVYGQTTFEQLSEAMSAGKIIYAKRDIGNGRWIRVPLTQYYPAFAFLFATLDADNLHVIRLLANGNSWSITSTPRSGATDQQLSEKMESMRYVSPQNLDYAIRAGLLSNSQITDADKPLICETIGAAYDGEWETLLDSDIQAVDTVSIPLLHDYEAFYVDTSILPNNGKTGAVGLYFKHENVPNYLAGVFGSLNTSPRYNRYYAYFNGSNWINLASSHDGSSAYNCATLQTLRSNAVDIAKSGDTLILAQFNSFPWGDGSHITIRGKRA